MKSDMKNRHVAIAGDYWKSRYNHESYLGLDAFSIDLEKESFIKIPLGIDYIDSPKLDKPEVRKHVKKVLSKFDIDENQILALVSDNGSNMKNLKFDSGSWMPCFFTQHEFISEKFAVSLHRRSQNERSQILFYKSRINYYQYK